MALEDLIQHDNNPVNEDEFINYDELISQLSTPTQNAHLYEKPPVSEDGSQIETDAGSASQAGFQGFSPDQGISGGFFSKRTEPIDPEKAARSGMRLAKLTDGTISNLAGMFIAKSDDVSRYKASEGDLQDLADAWKDITTEYNFDVSPWTNLFFVIALTYTPIVSRAFNDKRINELERQMRATNERIDELNRQQNADAKSKELESQGYGTGAA